MVGVPLPLVGKSGQTSARRRFTVFAVAVALALRVASSTCTAWLGTHSLRTSRRPDAHATDRQSCVRRCRLPPPSVGEPRLAATFEDDSDTARSCFGTKDYWDDVYAGRGDFPADEYSWYFGWEGYGRFVREFVRKSGRILVPGVGNDPVVLDLLQNGYRHITATDYSPYAIERQQDLMLYDRSDAYDPDDEQASTVRLVQMDARNMPEDWSASFDCVLEKGAFDAIYLSGDGNLDRTVGEVDRILKPGALVVSVSGVVSEELRRQLFPTDSWEWIHDGSDALKAGVFVLRKK